ncbi:hypothetical protein [Thalassospira mesophila]|nr:hypothetical protein [Thalassospira mesophila]
MITLFGYSGTMAQGVGGISGGVLYQSVSQDENVTPQGLKSSARTAGFNQKIQQLAAAAVPVSDEGEESGAGIAQCGVILPGEEARADMVDFVIYSPVSLMRPDGIDDILIKDGPAMLQNKPLRLGDIAIVPPMVDRALAYLRKNYRDVVAVIVPGGPQMTSKAKDGRPDGANDPRLPAYFVTADGALLQDHLLANGLAMMLPATDIAPDAVLMLPRLPRGETQPGEPVKWQRQNMLTRLARTEAIARRAQRGMWALPDARTGQAGNKKGASYNFYAPLVNDADVANRAGKGDDPGDNGAVDVKNGIGLFAVVTGKPVSVEQQKRRLYLNFGVDWHHDFTIALDQKQVETLTQAGINPADWVGRTVIVRGTIENRGGPYIGLAALSWLCLGPDRRDNT